MGDVADIDSSVGLPQEVVYTERAESTEGEAPQAAQAESSEAAESEAEAMKEATGLGNNIDVTA